MNSLGIDKKPAETRVVVAMSGGVDSSVTAALLREEGYEVVGITLQLYDHGAAVGRKGACCAGQDIHDARNVAARIDIPHYVLDYESRFRQAVIDDFAEAYARGETPIPCVRCNQTVKFRDLLSTAAELGADALATGHYVRRVDGRQGPELHRAADPSRDQSYFLFATTPEQLAFLRFPLGGLEKTETRALAARFGLPVAEKPDSQDICFVPNGSYARVVEKLRPEAVVPGEIVDLDGSRAGPPRRHHPLHGRPAAGHRHRRGHRRAATRTQSRSTWCGWSRRRIASSSGRGRRSRVGGSRSTASTGSARARCRGTTCRSRSSCARPWRRSGADARAGGGTAAPR